jgi:hypothetical protein
VPWTECSSAITSDDRGRRRRRGDRPLCGNERAKREHQEDDGREGAGPCSRPSREDLGERVLEAPPALLPRRGRIAAGLLLL